MRWLLYLPETHLSRILFVPSSFKGTRIRRKNEEGTKEERSRRLLEGVKSVVLEGCDA